MYKKILAILVVIMLVLPSTALAVGKPASVGGKTQGKPEVSQGKTTEDTGKGGNGSQLPSQAAKATENIPEDENIPDIEEFTKGNGREKAEQIVAEKKALKDEKVAEAMAIAEEKSAAAKNGAIGLKRAAEAITTGLSKVGTSAVAALQTVLGKFAAWIGLAGDDADQPGGGETGDENEIDGEEQPGDEEAGVEEGTTEEVTVSEDI